MNGTPIHFSLLLILLFYFAKSLLTQWSNVQMLLTNVVWFAIAKISQIFRNDNTICYSSVSSRAIRMCKYSSIDVCSLATMHTRVLGHNCKKVYPEWNTFANILLSQTGN